MNAITKEKAGKVFFDGKKQKAIGSNGGNGVMKLVAEIDNESVHEEPTTSSKTFRKRRLSVTKSLHENGKGGPQLSQLEANMRAAALALGSFSDDDSDDDHHPNEKRPRLDILKKDEEKVETAEAPLQPKFKYSQQMKLEVQTYCPLSHDLCPLPSGDTVVMTTCDDTRHISDEMLPFPRDDVFTYSCHGIEPIFDEYDEDVPTTVAKINQDRGGVAFPFGNCAKTALFAVYDGHGEGGEFVSQYALTEIPERLGSHPLLDTDPGEAFRQIFVSVDKSLSKEDGIEPNLSGTTACVVLMREKHLYIANVGDSRAVIGQKIQLSSKDSAVKSFYVNKDLSIDQNPDSQGEQERIIKSGGFVSPPPEPGLSARVWLDEECTQVGLAMSRSIGDHAVKDVGVIAEPVITEYEIDPNKDQFMILASDGVWEFLESSDAVQIVAEYLELEIGSEKACQSLIESAAAKWHEFEGDYRDDITAIIVNLKDLWGDRKIDSH